MARKTKAEALATRGDILDAAIAVFMERGVAGATLEQIAEAAGVTRGAIYWHFKNKIEIFRELNDEVQASFIESIVQDLDKNHPDPLQQLRELCTQLLLEIESNARKHNILYILLLRCDYSGELDLQLSEQMQNHGKNIRLIANYFKRAIEGGKLSRNANPQVLALSLMCYLSGIVHEYIRSPASLHLKQNAAQLVDQFFNGVGR